MPPATSGWQLVSPKHQPSARATLAIQLEMSSHACRQNHYEKLRKQGQYPADVDIIPNYICVINDRLFVSNNQGHVRCYTLVGRKLKLHKKFELSEIRYHVSCVAVTKDFIIAYERDQQHQDKNLTVKDLSIHGHGGKFMNKFEFCDLPNQITADSSTKNYIWVCSHVNNQCRLYNIHGSPYMLELLKELKRDISPYDISTSNSRYLTVMFSKYLLQLINRQDYSLYAEISLEKFTRLGTEHTSKIYSVLLDNEQFLHIKYASNPNGKDSEREIIIVDLSDPEQPKLINRLTTENHYGIALSSSAPPQLIIGQKWKQQGKLIVY
ncbi:unnamed protein product [Didymodactylos carnosus]|uniref:Uncharacterized protein n=1 Tax=Didymodactylos carnosus TaxID=1234261 RepID=A0A814UNL2_9BILA|nr:unnamed protein product [Didymodactylos carnosus]CAF3939858.1 unnamed protein product [Didymodactylos carnosus]